MLANKIIQVVFTKIYSRVCLRDNLLTWATVSLIIVSVVSLDFPVAQKRKRIKMTLKMIWKIDLNHICLTVLHIITFHFMVETMFTLTAEKVYYETIIIIRSDLGEI